MSYFLISKKRLKHHIQKDIKNGRGVFDWRITSDGFLEIYLSSAEVKYVYREVFNKDNIDMDVKFLMIEENRIYDYFDPEEPEYVEETNPLKEQMLREVYGVRD